MTSEMIIILVIAVLVIVGGLLAYRQLRGGVSQRVSRHLELIRTHHVLIKPDTQADTFSGRFAGRLLRFTFQEKGKKTIIIMAEVEMAEDDKLWLYPKNHRLMSDKLRATIEKNAAWTGNTDFDRQFMLAGIPRVFANAVIHPAKKLQKMLLDYPYAMIEVNNGQAILRPNIRNENTITQETWRVWMGLLADVAEYVEAQYTPSMFAGIEVDETAYPDHSGGHVN